LDLIEECNRKLNCMLPKIQYNHASSTPPLMQGNNSITINPTLVRIIYNLVEGEAM